MKSIAPERVRSPRCPAASSPIPPLTVRLTVLVVFSRRAHDGWEVSLASSRSEVTSCTGGKMQVWIVWASIGMVEELAQALKISSSSSAQTARSAHPFPDDNEMEWFFCTRGESFLSRFSRAERQERQG